MKHSVQRLVAIVLASSFALLSSIVIGGIVLENACVDGTSRNDTPSSRDTSAPSPRMSRLGTETSGQSKSTSPPAKKRSRPKSPPDILEKYPDGGARMVAKDPEGRKVVLPMVRSNYSVDIRGDLATVTVEQTFENPGRVPLDAMYQLPMGEDAAVYEMIMRVGDRRIKGVVQKKQKARETYEKAKDQGKAAALLEQQRANLFTQKLANVMPNQPVRVTIRYVENVDKIDGRYQMVVPLVVGPRYEPADMSGNRLVDSQDASSETASDDSSVDLPTVSELQAPETIDPERIGLEVRLDGGVPVGNVESATHAISTAKLDPRTRRIDLKKGRTIGNRHFVLSYDLEGRSTQAGVLTHWNEKRDEGYFSLLVEPPAEPAGSDVTSREMVFLLDTSGSMRGAPMEAVKTYMRQTLRNLRPNDTFRIVEFDSDTGAMSNEPLAATSENVERGLAYVENLEGDGGTELVPGLERALGPDVSGQRVRYATVLSDGYVGNEYEVVRTVRREIGETRLSVLGVGSGVNRFALEEMAELGRGFTRYIDPSEHGNRAEAIRKVASEVADKLETPVLTDLSVDWGELSPRETTPERIPDLFAGESVRIMGRYKEPGDYEIEVRGRAGGEPVAIPLQIHLPGKPTDGRAVELTWARSRVEDFMHRLMTPDQLRRGALGDEDLKRLVTRLGLTHDLATKWTSFVAVSERVVNPDPGANAEASVPEPQVANVEASGYDTASRRNGAPEPTALGALLMALLAGLGIIRRRR